VAIRDSYIGKTLKASEVKKPQMFYPCATPSNIYSATATTTDGSAITVVPITIPSSTTVLIEAKVIAKRTGGSAGSADDSAAYIVVGTYKNTGGLVTEVGEASIFSAEDQAAWTCTLTPNSNQVLIQFTGAAGNNITVTVHYSVLSLTIT